jgi:hypothetical protein
MVELKAAGRTVLVDDRDSERLLGRKLYMQGKYVYVGLEGRLRVRLQRFLLGLPAGDPRQVDHANCDPLDNRRANLRVCTPAENVRNRRRTKANTSGFKGVSRTRWGWRAEIRVDRKLIFLGHHKTPEAAHAAYWAAAQKHFGEFARKD